MRPGQPHFVYGPEHTIAYGGHFYASCLMQDTLQSVVHNFVLSNFITNTSHHASRELLRKLLLFFGLGLGQKRIQREGKSLVGLCTHWACSEKNNQILNSLTFLMLKLLTVSST
jgi:hypothetical protein